MLGNIWEDQIALNSRDEPVFELLPPAKDLTDRTSWGIDPAQLPLDKPLEYYLALDTAPLPAPEDREGYYGPRHFEFWLSGLEMYAHTMEICKKYGRGFRSYVELGSASGRTIRHMAAYEAFRELWAFDINWRHICWINNHLPSSIRAVQNCSIPTLPLPDESIDCISAMSVFSHVETFELHWLAELRRVLRPGGLLLVTVVTDHQIKSMDETWPMYNAITSHANYGPDFLQKLEQRGKLVLRWLADKSYSSNVIYSREYIQRIFSRFFEITEIRQEFPIYQDFLILRKI